MQKYILFMGLWLCSTLSVRAQLILHNSNSTFINNTTGTQLRITNGGISNEGSITNAANIYLTEDYWQGNALGSYNATASSWLWFDGAILQNITAFGNPDMFKIRVDNNNKLNLLSDIQLSLELDLRNNGNLQLNTFILGMNYTGNISNYDINHYVISNAQGFLERGMTAGDIKIFPVGNTTYNPLELFSSSGIPDIFGLRVSDAVLVSGTSGAPEANDHVVRTWHLSEAVAGGNLVDLTVEWDVLHELPNFNRFSCGVKHWDGASWDVPNYAIANNISGTRYQQSRFNQSTFSPFAVIDDNLLPIELLYFNAVRRDANTVLLDWATATEYNSDGFWLQRQLNQENTFENIAWINSLGNSTVEQYYDYKDNNAYSGISYYRLKQLDFSGEVSYSDIKAVAGEDKNHLVFSLFPNPTTDKIYIIFDANTLAQNAMFSIYSLDGKRIANTYMPIVSEQVLLLSDMQNVAAGTYFLRITLDSGAVYTQKFEKVTL
jgi:hypothetical protein